MKTNFNKFLYFRFSIFIVIVSFFFNGCAPELYYIEKDCTSLKGGITVKAGVNNNAYNNYKYIDFGGKKIKKDEITKWEGPIKKLSFEVPSWPIAETIEVFVVTEDDRSNSTEFTYREDTEIFSIEPTSGSQFGGTHVTIRGRNLRDLSEAFLSDGSKRSWLDDLAVISESAISGVTSSHPPGIVNLFLTCDTETCPSSDTLWQCYEYLDDPTPILGSPLGIGELIEGSYQYVAINDMNSDGNNDIVVVSNAIDEFGSTTVNVQVINGIKNVTISTFELPSDSKPSGVALGDFDLSGSIDIVVSLEGLGKVAVLYNDGRGNISGTDFIDVGDNPKAISVNDLDGDGNFDDIATANSSPASSVSIIIGKDDGSFETTIEISIYGGSTLGKPNDLVSITATNLDGVGNLDLAIANKSNNEAIILFNSGSSISYSDEYIKESLTEPVCVGTFDFNDDANTDLSTLDYGSANLSYWDGLHSSSLGSLKGLPISSKPIIMTVSGDSLTIGYEHGLIDVRSILDSDFLYRFKLNVEGGFILSMATGDLDADGTNDIVVGMRDYGAIIIVRSSETLYF